MFCHMCGQKLPENARFCPKCGTGVAQTPTAISEEHHCAAEGSGSYPAWLSSIGKKSSQITEEYREKIYNELSEVTLGGLDSGEISVEGSKEIAQFVLDRLDNINTRERLAGFFEELTQQWPVYEEVCSKLLDGSNHIEQTVTSSDFADKFMQDIAVIDAAAGNDGKVTDKIFKNALSLYETLEKSHDPALLAHANIARTRITLNFYHDVQIALDFFRRRWETDRLQRGRQRLFKRQMKVVVADYNTYGTSCKFAWDLVEYVGVPSIKHGMTTASFVMAYPRLLPYFDKVFVTDLFTALLMDEEDPRSHKNAFAGLKRQFGDRNIEELVRELTASH